MLPDRRSDGSVPLCSSRPLDRPIRKGITGGVDACPAPSARTFLTTRSNDQPKQEPSAGIDDSGAEPNSRTARRGGRLPLGRPSARARKLALQARIYARAAELPLQEAGALYQLASIAHQHQHADDAFALASEAVNLAETGEPNLTLAWSLHVIGVVHY
jgi:hypothetical protein